MSGRGKKLNQVKNERAHAEWMEGKKLGRTKQQWIWDTEEIARMNSLPKAQRDKKLLGLDGAVEGQYFECFDPYEHVIDLREDPEAIIISDTVVLVSRRLGHWEKI